MANIKNSKELSALLGKFIAAILESWKDKKFTATDLTNFIPPLLSIQEAIKGLNDVPGENINMTIPEVDELFAATLSSLGDGSKRLNYDIAVMLTGFLALYRIAATAGYNKRQEEEKGIEDVA